MTSKTDQEFLQIAREKVPESQYATGQVLRLSAQADADAADESTSLAKLLGIKTLPIGPDCADVVFTEDCPLGKRGTVVMIRGGKVMGVVKR